jgi:acyl-coenzyme A thioesterase PaaI-like protein
MSMVDIGGPVSRSHACDEVWGASMFESLKDQIQYFLYEILPLVKAMQIRVEEARHGYARVSMDRTPLIINHINAFHAGALYTFAETVAATLLAASFDLDRYVVINKRGEIKYRRLVTERCVSEVSVSEEELAERISELENAGKTIYTCPVVIKNPDGEVASEVTFDFVIRERVRDDHHRPG